MSRSRPIAARMPLTATACLVALGLFVALAPGVASSADTTSVSASISYTDGSKNKVAIWKDIKITIKRDGTPVLSGALLPEPARQSSIEAPRLLAVDLDDDGEAEVLVDVFTTGDDCCRRTAIYHYEDDQYVADVFDWAGTGYRLDDVAGKGSPEFLATDTRFPAVWSSDARGPLRILAYRNGKLRDISRQAPSQLFRDARIHQRAWRAIRKAKEGDARPVIAAYVADLVRLGKIDDAKAALRNAARADELGSSLKSFSKNLDRRLVAWGYSKHRQLS